ncbi:MAG TPA: hypothetical protein VGH04_14420 [Gemmatimonadaceae bacterium]
MRGESDSDDSKDVHSGKLAPPGSGASSEIPVIVASGPVIVASIPVAVAILGIAAVADLMLANRLCSQSLVLDLAPADLLVANELALARHLELTLALDLQLTLSCDLELALPTDLVLVDPIVVVVAVVAVHSLAIDQLTVPG